MKAALILIVIVAALLRFGGLSHDLHEGQIYHPDTPKQIRAVERFLKGRYHIHTGNIDYDGYPFLNSHLVEIVCRLGQPVQNAALDLLGVPADRQAPGLFSLYWLTLLLNATLATLAILVTYRLATESFGPTTGLIAALLLAFSPADITACHYANGDSSAGLFATLSLLFALRIYRHGRHRDYFFAVFFSVAGFAAKYHAGTVVFSIACAHVLRAGGLKQAFGREVWGRLALSAVTGVLALLICIPTLFTYPVDVLAHIYEFLTHVSGNRRLPREMRGAGFLGKFVFSMKRNIPLMFQILGPVALLAALARTVRPPRGKWQPILIIFLLPAVYFLVGVSMRPLSHAVYHTLMTPAVFVLAAALLASMFDREARPAAVWRWLGLAAVLAAVLPLSREAYREDYFQWHMDTRRMAKAWASENIPPSFTTDTGAATTPSCRRPGEGPGGIFHWSSSIVPWPASNGFVTLQEFSLERKPLTMFRNPSMSLSVGMSYAIRSGFHMPVVQRWPSDTGNQFVFEKGATFYRDGRLVSLKARSTVARNLAMTQPLSRAFVFVQNGPVGNRLELHVGGNDRSLFLKAGESAWYAVSNLTAIAPQQPGHLFYPVRAETDLGPARVLFATDEEDLGVALFQAGRYQEAGPWLEQAATKAANPTLSVLAELCRFITAPDKPVPSGPAFDPATNVVACTNEESVMAVYGISPDYLNALDFVILTTNDLHRRLTAVESNLDVEAQEASQTQPVETEQATLTSSPLMLGPGWYECSLSVTWTGSTATVRLPVSAADAFPGAYFTSSVPFQCTAPFAPATNSFCFYVRHGIPSTTLVFKPEPALGMEITRIRLRPAVLREVASLARIHRLIRDNDVAGAAGEPAAYEALLAAAKRLEAEKSPGEALSCYAAAAKLEPTLARPLQEGARLLAAAPDLSCPELVVPLKAYRQATATRAATVADVRFENRVRLVGAAARESTVKRGGSFGLNLHWRLDDREVDVFGVAVFVHGVDATGTIMFQGDHDLLLDLNLPADTGEITPFFNEIDMPATIKPGVYQMRVGLYTPRERRQFKIREADLAHGKRYAILPFTLTVTE